MKFYSLAALALSTVCFGCLYDAEEAVTEEAVTEEAAIAEAASELISVGWHGLSNLANVKVGSVVDQHLVEEIPSNPNHSFWWFCGQASTATAINFARNTTPSNATKIGQLQWFHERLLARHPNEYKLNNSAGPFATSALWLFNLMNDEKSNEFTSKWLTHGSRDVIKSNIADALDTGAYVVALNKTSNNGAGHFLTVYALYYNPQGSAEGGIVYFGDVLSPNSLKTLGFKTFLDRMLAQSDIGVYNAFSVKKK
jgi:hypothetical protein